MIIFIIKIITPETIGVHTYKKTSYFKDIIRFNPIFVYNFFVC